jgi:hypothetical protein
LVLVTPTNPEDPNMSKQAKAQVVATIFSFALLAGLATSVPVSGAADQPQSFVGTTPDASTIEALPPTF